MKKIKEVSNDDMLKTLYAISKLLSKFESIEKSFPLIIERAADIFPLKTVYLIEHWSGKVQTSFWHLSEISSDILDRAHQNAKKSYVYLTGVKLDLGSDVFDDEQKSEYTIVLPLIIDNLPAQGIIQLEGTHALNERNLEFVSALADLIGVALDRYYKSQKKDQIQIDKVSDMEKEKAMREGFVSLLTHDLRTPLSAAMLLAQNIVRKKGDTSVCLSYAEKIFKNLKRADRMISDLLDANRLRSGEKLPINREHFDLYELASEVVDEFANIHDTHIVLCPEKKICGFWDKINIRRIFENLINNAVKYGQSGSPVHIDLKDIGDEVMIIVTNWGNPIPLENQESLFDQFSRSKSANLSSIQGWGIGLTLVRGVSEAHGGCVSVTSESVKGTSFTVKLPRDNRAL